MHTRAQSCACGCAHVRTAALFQMMRTVISQHRTATRLQRWMLNDTRSTPVLTLNLDPNPKPYRMETVHPEHRAAPSFQRPVIRDEARGVMYTRIQPTRRETSMIMHIRPGWEQLRTWLTGQQDGVAG